MLPKFSSGNLRLAGRDPEADAALRRARHLFPQASRSRNSPPVECLVVQSEDLGKRRPFRHPFNNPKKENGGVCGAPFCEVFGSAAEGGSLGGFASAE